MEKAGNQEGQETIRHNCLNVSKSGDARKDRQPYTAVNDPRFQVSDVYIQKQIIFKSKACKPVILIALFSC